MNGTISMSSWSPFSWTVSVGRESGLGYHLLCLEGQQGRESGCPAQRGKAVAFGGPNCGLGCFAHSSSADNPPSPWMSELCFMLVKEEAEAQPPSSSLKTRQWLAGPQFHFIPGQWRPEPEQGQREAFIHPDLC